jgi:hypothetical protein
VPSISEDSRVAAEKVQVQLLGQHSQVAPLRKAAQHFKPGLWIRIDSIRIRIQKFSSIQIRIRIRIHNVIESGSTTVL